MTAPARIPLSVPEWHATAACRLFPDTPDLWADPKTDAQKAVARVVCRACPVRLQCAIGALERREPWGIWGGLDRADRKKIAARYGYLPPGDPPEHGTNARRVKWGCDCHDCRRAHALYEAERRANQRRAALKRGLWVSPLAVVRPVTIGRRRQCMGQLVLPLPGLPPPRWAEPIAA